MKKNELIKLFSEKNREKGNGNEIINLLSSSNKTIDIPKGNAETQNYKVLWENIMEKEDMISIRKHSCFVDIPNHSHNYIELFFVLQGEITQEILKNKITIKEGELLFLNQGISHQIKSCSQDDIAINIIIRPKFFENIFNFICFDSKIRDFFLDSIFSYRSENGLFFQISQISSLQKTMLEIITEFLQEDGFSKYRIQLLLSLLITDLAKYSEHMLELNQQSYDNDVLIKVLNYIETQYPTASLDQISKQLNLPNYYISKLVKKSLNANFLYLIQSKRLEKAVDLLMNSTNPITKICNSVGYDNWNFFYKLFKEKFGMTPKEYRIKFKN